MDWYSTPPGVPGYYWFRTTPGAPPRVSVVRPGSNLTALPEGEWSGPIRLPGGEVMPIGPRPEEDGGDAG